MREVFKKAIAVLSAAVMLTAFSACGNAEPQTETTTPTTKESEAVVTTTEAPTEKIEGKGSLLDSEIEIVSAELAEDYKGNSCVVVTYKWKNTSDEPAAFIYSVSCSAYQNGVELSDAYIIDKEIVDTQATMNKIKPGVEIEIKDAYLIADETADIEIEVSDSISFDGDPVITKTFSLK